MEKVKAFLPKINEANNGLNVAESDDFEIKEVNVTSDEESDESDVDFSNEEKPVVKVVQRYKFIFLGLSKNKSIFRTLPFFNTTTILIQTSQKNLVCLPIQNWTIVIEKRMKK